MQTQKLKITPKNKIETLIILSKPQNTFVSRSDRWRDKGEMQPVQDVDTRILNKTSYRFLHQIIREEEIILCTDQRERLLSMTKATEEQWKTLRGNMHHRSAIQDKRLAYLRKK